MTVTDTARDSVASAVELGAGFSHLNPPPSYDLADHPVPTGREEIWRFTPLKRLRGILDGEASDASLTWETSLPEGVTMPVVSSDEAREAGELAPDPVVDRLAVQTEHDRLGDLGLGRDVEQHRATGVGDGQRG